VVQDRKKEPSPPGKTGGHSSTSTDRRTNITCRPFNCCNRANSTRHWLPLKSWSLGAHRIAGPLQDVRLHLSAATGAAQADLPHAEEHFDYAISQLNTGYYEEAREQFEGILSGHPNADYAFYGLALLDAITGRTQDVSAIWREPSN